MSLEELSYAEAQSKLLGLLGHEVDAKIAGADGCPPLTAYFTGKLESGGDVYGGHIVGYDPEALILYVGGLGGVQLTLHPNYFVTATWREDATVRELAVRMGDLVISMRTGPE